MLNLAPTPPAEFRPPKGDVWVFGYGSLMWRPGFEHIEGRTARLHGYHRALCVWSWHHRGSEAEPGLVFGLDLGGSCLGTAYLVAEARRDEVLRYLYAREMVTPVYVPKVRRVRIEGESIPAVVFVLDRGHPQYAGKLQPGEVARVVAAARGASGANPEYVANAVRHFESVGITDRRLAQIHALIAAGAAR